MKEKELFNTLKKAKIVTEDSLNEKFFKDLTTLFWRRTWNKWSLEKYFKEMVDKKYEKLKKEEKLITKNDIRRDFLEIMKNNFIKLMDDLENNDRKEMSYIG